ncbi:MAG: 3-oxoacyl-ACP synthase [Bacteroidetes bacterium]|nr:3-oxoacyl-ACP synthase [Bacteroidota bacterium]
MLLKNLKITSSCIICFNKVIINDKLDFVEKNYKSFPSFIKSVYRNYKIGYPKFFKMDNLSKLGFITSELLLKQDDLLSNYKNDEIGIIISNSGSSIDTDIKYYNTIKDKSNYFPSPSVFVYTLPNIMIGEICIRNKIMGESSFFISEKFNPDFLCNYINILFNTSKIKSCISGWVEYEENNYESFLFLVEKENKKNNGRNINFEPENILMIK